MSQARETRLQMPSHSDGGQAFFTSVGCMDGRAQEPVLVFGQKKFGAKYADTITEAGLVGLLARLQMPPASNALQSDAGWSALADGGQAKNNIDQVLLNSLKKKILISIEKHHSKGIVVHGHQECAGNPVADEQHKKDVLKAAKTVTTLIQKYIQIIPVFVTRSGLRLSSAECPGSGQERQGAEWIVEELVKNNY